ncbi:PREDICTED: periaxin [Gekko japonicus]|uniref:Periaxin n=1 Tax=Gekko japonicus TaxID=146911 RepID=A0ABM1JNV0_GEKJA|nr:PREDICTED: periaxin [Gekko japonicus]
MEAQLRKMEKTIETSELLEIIVETEAEAGVSGMSVAGGGKQGLFVKDVLKGSPAARALSLKEGDQLLSARVYFDNMKYEDALQILKSAEPYKVSFCLKRTVPSTDVTRSPGAPTFEVRGPRAKMAKLNIQSLKKKKAKKAGKGLAKDLREGEAPGGKLEVAPVDVEFSLPKFSKLRKARSAGEVAAAARPSPDLSPLLSSLDTKRRKLRLPRLKVKEALAARAAAAGRLEGAPPKPAPEGAAGAKGSRFTIPFAKGKKPKEEATAAVGLRPPQVELDLPMPKVGPGRESPRAGHKGAVVQVPPLGLPEVEVVLPRGGPKGAPEEGSLAGLSLPTAEVAAPEVDVALSLPSLEGRPPPEVALLRGEGLQIKVPKVGVSAEGAERKPPLLDVILGKGRGRAEGPEEQATLPLVSLGVGLPSVGVEIPLPGGKAEAEAPKPTIEIPEVSIKVPSLSLPKLGAREGEGESRVPQVELSVGQRESPKAKGQTPGFGISLTERKPEAREESKAKSLGFKMPSLDIAAPKVSDMQLPKALGGPEEAVEGPRFKLQVPQVSLPKCSLPTQAVPPPPPPGPKKPEGEAGGKGGVPALALSLPAVKPPEVQLPKGHVPKPELELCVDRPRVEVALPAAQRLSFPVATVPALELDLPRAGIELGLPKGPDHPPRDHGDKLKMPALEALSKDLAVEVSVPKCREEPLGPEAPEGLGVGAIVAKIPQVDLAFGKEEAAEAKLPSVEVSAVKLPRVTIERGRSPEAEAKLKSPKFALPKFSLSGPKAWKVSTELFGAAQGGGPDEADKGSKLKLPKFGISFPKSKGGADAEGPQPGPGERRSRPGEEGEPAESRMKLPSVGLPKVDVGVPQLGLGLPTGKAESSDEEGAGAVPELGLELPDIKRKMPKFSLPKFGGKDKEGDVELETGEALAGERKGKASKFKVALFGMAGRDLEGAGPGGEGKARAGAESPKEKPRGPLVKMPKLKLPSPKAELGQGHVPQVELPKISLPGASAEEALLVGSESLKAKVPSLEVAMPGATTKGEPAPGRPRARASGADHRRHEAGPKITQAPSLGVSAPKVELDLSLPTVGAEAPVPRGAPGAEAKTQLPQVELPTFGRGGEQGAAEASKIRVPQVDLSLPTAPSWTEGEGVAAGPDGGLHMPSVELPKFSTPKARAPECEGGLEGGGKMLPAVELSGPALHLPKFRGPGSEAEGEGDDDVGLPQLELKVPKLGGSAERLGVEAGAKEGRATVPCPPSSFGLCRAEEEEEEAAFGPDSKFKLKMPSLSLSRAGAEPRADTQPLCPSRKEEEDASSSSSFRMPQVTLPGVGFSVAESGGQRKAKVEAGKLASAEGPEAEGSEARLKVPKIEIPALGVSAAPQDPEGRKGAFRVPGLELATPTLKGHHAEYEVEGAQLRHGGSQEPGGAGGKSPGGGGEASEAEAGRKYKVRIPKFGLSLPKAGEGAPGGQEGEAKAKRPAFALGRPKGRGAEGSPGLLEGEEEEEEEGKGVMGRLRLGLSRLTGGSEAELEEEEGSPSGRRLPKLGFSDGEGPPGAALQNGTPDGQGKLGKVRLPQVELSSPSAAAAAGAEGDPELSLKLVRAEGEGEAAKEGGPGAFAALRFKPPKITFSGFRKRNGEPAPGAVVASGARMEMASLERGEAAARPPKFKFPKVALSPKSHGLLEIASSPKEGGRRGSHEGLKVQLPRVGFSEEAGAPEGPGKATAAV